MRLMSFFVVSLSAAVAHGQFFEVVVDKNAVDLDIPGDNVVLVSVYMDRDGAMDAPWDLFHGWQGAGGYLAADGGVFESPVEIETEVSSDPWLGRRPPSVYPSQGGSNGGFRWFFPEVEYTVSTGDLSIPELSTYDTVLAGYISMRAFEFGQANSVFGGFNHNLDERIEVFRARLIFDRGGTHSIHFHPVDAFFFDTTDFISTVLGAHTWMSVTDVVVVVDSDAPYAGRMSGNRDLVVEGKRLMMTVGEVIDLQDDVSHVRFFRDANHNGRLDNFDQFLGRDGNGSNGWFYSALSDPSWETGEQTFFAQAVDFNLNRSVPASMSTEVLSNGDPYANRLSLRRKRFRKYEFRAHGLLDADGDIAEVRFYRDSNGDGELDSGDEMIGVTTDIPGSGASYIMVGWPSEWGGYSTEHTFFTQVIDDLGNESLVRSLTARRPTIITATHTPCPADRNGDGWLSASDLADYLNAYASGAGSADLDGTPGVDQFDLVRYVELWDKGCE